MIAKTSDSFICCF